MDLTTLPAAYATRLLVETGHDVIRVEPAAGDALRRMGPFLAERVDLEHGAFHQFLNAGKRSLTLDLASAAGQQVFERLLGSSDGVIGSDALVDADSLHIRHPSLVITVVTDDEPELCLWARTGLLSIAGQPDRVPLMLGEHLGYGATGLYVAFAAITALLGRTFTGRGQIVTVSLRQALENLMEQSVTEYTFTGKGTERRGTRGSVTATSGALPCKDGYWLLSLIRDERWTSLVEWMQDPVLMADPSLADEANRQKQRDFILDRIEAWASQFTKTELVTEAQRRHIPASPIATPLDLVADPQLVHRGYLRAIEHPEFGRVHWPVGALAAIRGADVGLPPRLGQHNAEILAELGYTPADHEALVATGAV